MNPSGIFFENPDGSLHHALPAGRHYKRARSETPPLMRIWDPAVTELVQQIYAKHERVLVVLLVIQFLLESAFSALLIKHRDDTATEIFKVYPFVTEEFAPFVFWTLMGISSFYTASYYISACLAIWDRRAAFMKGFTDVAILGIIGQIFFAYINRFNLFIFFLRFVVFGQARFLVAILTGDARIVISTREPLVLDV